MKDNAYQFYFRAACLLGALAVVFGAFGAHGLKTRLDADHLGYWHTAVEYHFYHALASLALAAGLGSTGWSRWASRACAAWMFGVTVFSGSLYLLAVTDMKWLGAITPFGGLAFILGWLFALGAVSRSGG